MLRKIIPLIIITMVLLTPLHGLAFTDTSLHWAESDIDTLNDVSILGGYPDNTFRPNSNVTRVEFICMVMRTISNHIGQENLDAIIAETAQDQELLPWEEEFDEVYSILRLSDSYWATGTVFDAVKLRLLPYEYGTGPYNNIFILKAAITRGEAAYIMTQAAKFFDLQADRMLLPYLKNEIKAVSFSTYAYSNAALDAYALGLLTGYGDGRLKPTSLITRAEAAATLIRLFDTDRLSPYTPEGAPFIILENLANYPTGFRYYAPLADGEPQLDVLNFVKLIDESLVSDTGYRNLVYNPQNAVLGVEFYDDEGDYLTLEEADTRDEYITRLANFPYMTLTISALNTSNYSASSRATALNSKYNPYLLISWGNSHEQDIIENHWDILTVYCDFLFGTDSQQVLDKIERYLTKGEGGATTYQTYGGRLASWKPVGNGIFMMEIMEVYPTVNQE